MTDGPTHRLGREAIHTYWDNALPPRLTIAPGDTVVFDTLEASHGRVARRIAEHGLPGADPDLVALVVASSYPEAAGGAAGHPLTGPVSVQGAEPGDTLTVEVVAVELAAWGWTSCGPGGGGLLRDEFPEWTTHVWDLRAGGDSAPFAPGIRVPLAPFCGVMGVAPAAPGQFPTTPPGPAGGNMDVRQLTAGSTLFLPVQAPGAGFSVGDAHAAQGDGEVAGTGIEVEATVTLRFGLQKGRRLPGPRFIAPSAGRAAGPWFATTGHNADLREAAREALRGVLDELMEEHGVDRAQAVVLASACVDLRISQIVNGGVYTVSALLPLGIFRE